MADAHAKITKYLKTNKTFYISITGLKVKSPWSYIFFIFHAVRSKIQADQSPGLLFSDVKKINGIEHTVTVWENKKAMQKYIYTGHHSAAIKAFKKIATGKTFGYESDIVPTWDEVPKIWQEKGKDYDK